MREITDHKVNSCNDKIAIQVTDEPGAGGANHSYEVSWPNPNSEYGWFQGVTFKFQNGPIQEVGTNGVTQEVLLAIVADRLRSFQNGPYSCLENGVALQKVEEALEWLKRRTESRLARGVEGTHTV